ncbi:putative nuclease HARBI1 isoform X1 [Folsomia candida]|uniref:putative nuclease HARBI1 isoform X1 n=1 Tax=Folsomia candida TaxID=158441 RepID=UPI001604FFBB|nr:putative nuclease HARBI1 isoform X1 [Folsomia candida]XP_021959031.2 putative nuclease HARBI1 isoform X1 [Folsomia candida]
MAIPLFVLNNERNRVYKQRRLLESLSEFEIRKHTGLPWWGARELIEWIEPEVEPLARRNYATPAETKILTTLGFFRSGSFQWMLGTVSGTSQPSCSRIIAEVSSTLQGHANEMIRFPASVDERNIVSNAFYQVAGLPNVIGIVDGSHVLIKAPTDHGGVYINRKQRHSINVQIICNHQDKITDIVAKYPGSSHDSFIMRNSAICHRFQRGEFGNNVLIGDSGYFRAPYLAIPFSRRAALSVEQQLFNTALTKTRSKVERCIGLWKCRFRSMHKSGGDLCYEPAKVCKLITASVVLHNYCVNFGIPLLDEDEHQLELIIHGLAEDELD